MHRSEKFNKKVLKPNFRDVINELKNQYPEWKEFIDRFAKLIKPIWYGNQGRFQTHFIHVFGLGFKKDWDRIFSAFLYLSNWNETKSRFTLRKESIFEDWELFVKESEEYKMPQILLVEDGFGLFKPNFHPSYLDQELTPKDEIIFNARNWLVNKRDLKLINAANSKAIASSGTLVISWFELGETLTDKIGTLDFLDSHFTTFDFWDHDYENRGLQAYVKRKIYLQEFKDEGILKFMEDHNNPKHLYEAILDSQSEINYLLKVQNNFMIWPDYPMYQSFVKKFERVPEDLNEFRNQMTQEVLGQMGFIIEVMKFVAENGTGNVFDTHHWPNRRYKRSEIYIRGKPCDVNIYQFPVGSLEELFVKNS